MTEVICNRTSCCHCERSEVRYPWTCSKDKIDIHIDGKCTCFELVKREEDIW